MNMLALQVKLLGIWHGIAAWWRIRRHVARYQDAMQIVDAINRDVHNKEIDHNE